MALALLLGSITRAQVPVALSPLAKQQFLSITGAPLAGGCLNTYITGSSTPLATYTDGTGTAQNTNPIILDAGGFANIWLSNSSYRFTLTSAGGVNCATGVFQYTVDNVSAYTVINQAQNIFLLGAASDPGGSAGELAYRTDIPCFRGFSTLWDCFVTLTATQTLSNKTFASPAFTGTATGFVGTSSVLNNPNVNGTVVNGPPATYLVMANDLATGTTLNKLAKINPAGLAGFAILPLITDTGGMTGIVVAGAGITGNATIQQNGSASCVFDNAVTSGDYVQVSSTVAGDCHDSGVAYPSSNQVLGRVLATNVAAGTYLIDLFGPEIKAGNQGATVGCTNFTPATVTNNNAIQTLISCTIPANTLTQGSLLNMDLTGVESTAAGQNTIYTISLGGGTPCLSNPTQGVANNQPYNIYAKFAVLTTGAGGTANWSCGYASTVSGGGVLGPNGIIGTPTISVNTTISNVLLIQEQMSVANAGNSVTGQLLKAVLF